MSRYDELTADGARQLLRQIGQQLQDAEGARRLAMQRLENLMGDARGLLPMTEIAELTGLTRPTLYKLLED